VASDAIAIDTGVDVGEVDGFGEAPPVLDQGERPGGPG